MRVVVVRPDEYLPQVTALLAANWRETGFDFDLDPDVEAYTRLTEAGLMFALAAIEADHVVGYCTVLVAPNLFNRQVVIASSDALFVAPDARRGLTSGRLIRAAEDEARERGASRFLWHTRAGTPFAAMLQAHGYHPADTVVMRTL